MSQRGISNEAEREGDVGPGLELEGRDDTARGLRSYLIGFVLAVGLTAASFWAVQTHARVDIHKTLHMTASGADFAQINPTGYVPILQLDDGSLLSEGAVIVQYLADLNPQSGLMPPAGMIERYRLQSWLNFVATELHKMYSPWLFHPEYGAAIQQIARDKIAERLTLVEGYLAEQGPYLTGEQFTAGDAYLFVIVGWSTYAKVDLTPFSNLRAFMAQVGSRPKVREALAAERVKLSTNPPTASSAPRQPVSQ